MTSVYCPEMHCLCTSGAYKQPNMRLFSLNEQDEWTLWRSNSDYFYPEMIPEPDYSDSGDDAGSESEEYISSLRNSRPVAERLRDVTEVYVANEDVKIKKSTSSKTTADSSSKKQTSKAGEKIERQPREKSPKTLPKAPRKTRSKSPPTVGKKISTRPKSPSKATDSKSKATAGRTKSPEASKKAPSKPKTTVQVVTQEKSKTSKTKPKAGVESQSLKVKASSKKKTEIKPSTALTKKEAGDAPKISPVSSPTSDESQSGVSSAGHSSDDDLIKPRKLYPLSTEKQKLHKELKFSQRYGRLVSPKTELQLAIERFTENKEKKGFDIGEKTSLEKILEIQARKINMQETTDNSCSWMDHLQRPPATLPNPKTDEFYRVHARVVNSNILTHCFLADDDQNEYQSSQTLTQTESGSDS